MNSDDLVVGEEYALRIAAGEDCVRVRLKSTEARYSSKVTVVPAHGDDSGGMEVPLAKLVSSWTDHIAENVVLVDTAAFWDVAWIPEVGEQVELEGTAGIRWSVLEVSLSENEEWAVIRGELFGQPQERTVSITQLRPATSSTTAPSAYKLEEMFEDHGIAPLHWHELPDAQEAPQPSPSIEPVGDIRPETVAGRLVFSEKACQSYRSLESRCQRGDEQRRMRSEVARKGRLGKTRRRQGFARYVVPRRFEFMVAEDPTQVEGDLWIDEIQLLPQPPRSKSRRKKPRSSRRRRRGGGGRK
jgi:hypothetical protein